MTLVEMWHLTWLEAKKAAENPETIALIPTGSIEQHGPHLPLSTDAVLAEAIASRVGGRAAPPVVVAPVVPGGLSDHHTGFPGTVTFSEELFAGLIDAYIAAMARTGIRRIAVISGHGGNFRFLGEFEAKSAERWPELQVRAYSDLQRFIGVTFDAAADAGLVPPPTDIHAGMIETSIALYLLGPASVRHFDSVEGYTAAEGDWLQQMAERGVASLSSSGVLGSPPGATREAGERIVEALVEDVLAWLQSQFSETVRSA